MPSFYKNRKDIKNNAGYVENYQIRRDGVHRSDHCQVCSYCGESVFDCYLCAKNPWMVVSVCHQGHCECFTHEEIKFNKLQKLVLNLKLFEFKFPHRVK